MKQIVLLAIDLIIKLNNLFLYFLCALKIMIKFPRPKTLSQLVESKNAQDMINRFYPTSTDGLTIASALSSMMDEDRVGAMAAAMLSLGDRTATELARGELEQVMIKGDNGYVLLIHAGPEAVLSVIARKEAQLGLVFLDASAPPKQSANFCSFLPLPSEGFFYGSKRERQQPVHLLPYRWSLHRGSGSHGAGVTHYPAPSSNSNRSVLHGSPIRRADCALYRRAC
jgi:predicted regulator of Ras-like GTPase activity (Roadblock/LC7/MglB family)